MKIASSGVGLVLVEDRWSAFGSGLGDPIGASAHHWYFSSVYVLRAYFPAQNDTITAVFSAFERCSSQV
jgi:hypothetical protein